MRGFNPWVWQLKMCTGFLLVFFSFIHFTFRQVPGNFLRSSLLLCHAATDVISRDDKVEGARSNQKAKAASKMFSGRSVCFGNCLPCQPEGSQTCLVWGNAHQPLPASGKGGGSCRLNQHPELWAASGFGGAVRLSP